MINIDTTLQNLSEKIEAWFQQQWPLIPPPFYCSTDLRRSGFKLAPVDTNLFPGGYNNLNSANRSQYAQAAKNALSLRCPQAREILLIPENHTRNTFYLENVAALVEILEEAGLVVKIGTLLPDIHSPMDIPLPNGKTLTLFPIHRSGDRLSIDHFSPDTILLNNDLSGGVPDCLKRLNGQCQLVDLRGGWWLRRKSIHFNHYTHVVHTFAEAVGIDPWLIDPYFAVCNQVNFQKHEGVPCLAEVVDDILTKTQKKYRDYGIEETPYVILKADAGTYGMGVMAIRDAAEVVNLNRKQRNKMSVIKDGIEVQEVIIQEGIRTIEKIDGKSAESVIYLFGKTTIGGFYRINTDRGDDDNLNASGMGFVPFGTEETPMEHSRCYANSVVGRLAAMAAGSELAELAQLEKL